MFLCFRLIRVLVLGPCPRQHWQCGVVQTLDDQWEAAIVCLRTTRLLISVLVASGVDMLQLARCSLDLFVFLLTYGTTYNVLSLLLLNFIIRILVFLEVSDIVLGVDKTLSSFFINAVSSNATCFQLSLQQSKVLVQIIFETSCHSCRYRWAPLFGNLSGRSRSIHSICCTFLVSQIRLCPTNGSVCRRLNFSLSCKMFPLWLQVSIRCLLFYLPHLVQPSRVVKKQQFASATLIRFLLSTCHPSYLWLFLAVSPLLPQGYQE